MDDNDEGARLLKLSGGSVGGKFVDSQPGLLCNDEGATVSLGNVGEGADLYYCGRMMDIPGTDGQCGPNNGPQCPSCKRLQNELAQYKYAVTMAKMFAGLVRFVCEDVLSGTFQLIYLCKLWLDIDWKARAFTMASVATGLFTSLLGPMTEYCRMRGIKSSLKDAEEPNSNDGNQSPSEKVGNAARTVVDRHALVKYRPKIAVVHNHTVERIVGGAGNSKHIRKVLVCGSAAFWALMLALPFLSPVGCGEGPRAVTHLAFFSMSMLLVLVETWIVVQTRTGYLMFKHLRLKFISAYVLGILGRFDTYSDVMFAKMISSCPDITWFSVHGHKFYLPFGIDLATLVVGVLVLGVICMQAVPGLVLLALRPEQLATGCKLNEYALLLAVMEAEAHEDNDILKAEEDSVHAGAEVYAKFCTAPGAGQDGE